MGRFVSSRKVERIEGLWRSDGIIVAEERSRIVAIHRDERDVESEF